MLVTSRHSSRKRTTRFLVLAGGGSAQPLDADPPPTDAGHATCDASWEANLVNRMTYAGKNITLSKTPFTGGKNTILLTVTHKC